MKRWKILNIPADDNLLEDVLNHDMERKGRVVKEILFIESYGQFKIIYTEEDILKAERTKESQLNGKELY